MELYKGFTDDNNPNNLNSHFSNANGKADIINDPVELVPSDTPLTLTPSTTIPPSDLKPVSRGSMIGGYLGLAGGLLFAVTKKSGVGGYFGWGILGSVIGSITGGTIGMMIKPKAIADASSAPASTDAGTPVSDGENKMGAEGRLGDAVNALKNAATSARGGAKVPAMKAEDLMALLSKSSKKPLPADKQSDFIKKYNAATADQKSAITFIIKGMSDMTEAMKKLPKDQQMTYMLTESTKQSADAEKIYGKDVLAQIDAIMQ